MEQQDKRGQDASVEGDAKEVEANAHAVVPVELTDDDAQDLAHRYVAILREMGRHFRGNEQRILDACLREVMTIPDADVAWNEGACSIVGHYVRSSETKLRAIIDEGVEVRQTAHLHAYERLWTSPQQDKGDTRR